MRIAIAGNGSLAFNMMKALLESQHQVVALVQNGRAVHGWKRAMVRLATSTFAFESTLNGLAYRKGMPTIWINKMNDAELEPLRRLEPDILLVGGFGIILKKPVLDLPRVACVNAHTSLLPRHRGPNPFSAVILQKETETGLTFHLIDEGIDTGDILAQFPFPVEDADTAFSIYRRGCDVAGEHVVEVMDKIQKKGVLATPQDDSKATYDQKLSRDDYKIDWTRTADDYNRLMRAGRPFFTPWFMWRGNTVYLIRGIFKKEPVDPEPGTVLAVDPRPKVALADGSCTIVSAIGRTRVPWMWPAPWQILHAGDRLNPDGR
ncbi:MAG: methionyl-tRNA formyltransferase [Candidatus Hydrogenedentes bacterium]|nr:methionyl-tRNA formyltransferase [Candidatus Hydrogenedentota bacterium]